MPRPELFPVKKVVGFNQNMIESIDVWRAKQKPIPNVSEAIRRLVELGLAAPTSMRGQTVAEGPTARDLAAAQIDRMGDVDASKDEQATRKRRLLKGPPEFRDSRVDLETRAWNSKNATGKSIRKK